MAVMSLCSRWIVSISVYCISSSRFGTMRKLFGKQRQLCNDLFGLSFVRERAATVMQRLIRSSHVSRINALFRHCSATLVAVWSNRKKNTTNSTFAVFADFWHVFCPPLASFDQATVHNPRFELWQTPIRTSITRNFSIYYAVTVAIKRDYKIRLNSEC